MEGRDQNWPEQGCEQPGAPQAGGAADLQHHQCPELPGRGVMPEGSAVPKGSPLSGKKRRTWLWVLAGALLLAGVAAAVLLTVVLPAGSVSTLEYKPINPMMLIAEDVAAVREAAGGGFYVVMDTADGLQEIEYYAPGANQGELVAESVTNSGIYLFFDRILYITDDEYIDWDW